MRAEQGELELEGQEGRGSASEEDLFSGST